jgi:hypothetical protein
MPLMVHGSVLSPRRGFTDRPIAYHLEPGTPAWCAPGLDGIKAKRIALVVATIITYSRIASRCPVPEGRSASAADWERSSLSRWEEPGRAQR